MPDLSIHRDLGFVEQQVDRVAHSVAEFPALLLPLNIHRVQLRARHDRARKRKRVGKDKLQLPGSRRLL